MCARGGGGGGGGGGGWLHMSSAGKTKAGGFAEAATACCAGLGDGIEPSRETSD